MIKYTIGFVDKLEDILQEAKYTVRYERGNFQSGWCLLDHKRVVVLNKFLNTEGRVNTLVDLIPQLKIDYDKLTLSSQKLFEFLTENRLEKLDKDGIEAPETAAGVNGEDTTADEINEEVAGKTDTASVGDGDPEEEVIGDEDSAEEDEVDDVDDDDDDEDDDDDDDEDEGDDEVEDEENDANDKVGGKDQKEEA